MIDAYGIDLQFNDTLKNELRKPANTYFHNLLKEERKADKKWDKEEHLERKSSMLPPIWANR